MIKKSNTKWRGVPTATIEWQSDATPRSPKFDDIYYSPVDGVAETQYVYVEGSQLKERLQSSAKKLFCIVETGFGSGLNFLASWDLWRNLAGNNTPRLQFVSTEKYPLSRKNLARTLDHWPQFAQLSEQLCAQYPGNTPGQHRLVFEGGNVILDLWWADSEQALEDLAAADKPCVDAWYLDGFNPAKNSAMWTPALYAHMARMSHSKATVATFTAASAVRRGLSAVGFEVLIRKGFGLKRHHITASFQADVHSTPPIERSAKALGIDDIKSAPVKKPETPWDLVSTRTATAAPELGNTAATAVILGAGLAGCTTAAALARRGFQVTVCEQKTIASGGSGNDQGVLYTRFSNVHSPLTDFAITSFCYSHRYYQQLLATGILEDGKDGNLGGSFHLMPAKALDKLREAIAEVPELAIQLDPEEAALKIGLLPSSAGLWLPQSGWINPSSLCGKLLEHENIRVLENTGPLELQHDAQDAHGNLEWRVLATDDLIANQPTTDISGKTIAQGQFAILATGPASVENPLLASMPLLNIRGQISALSSADVNSNGPSLQAAVCHTGYIAPSINGCYHIGASFQPNDKEQSLRDEDHLFNLSGLASALPSWQAQLGQIAANVGERVLGGRAAWRCTSKDYLPLIGPVPDEAAFRDDYRGLSENAKRSIPNKGRYIDRLYLNIAHGSRGLTSAPFAAELIASQICGELSPLGREISRAVAPGRFIIRELIRKS